MLKQSIDSTSIKITIGTIPIFPGNFITSNIRNFMKLYPQTKFDISTCIDNKEVIDGIKDELYDLGFCFMVDKEKDLVFVPMIKRELVVITKVGHELSMKKRLILSDLRGYPLITYRENNPLGIFIRKVFKDQNIVPNIVFAFDEEITISEMVAQDFGIAILANIPVLRHYLPIIPLDTNSDSPLLYLGYHKNSNHSKSIKNFIDLLKESSIYT